MRETRLLSFQDYTFDPASGDLVRSGRRLRIQQQTSVLLGILLERAGTVVTRNELQLLLWPNGEFLDYDHAINRVINQLRYVLRDNTRSPHFIETVPKRGYRFLVPVSVVTSPTSLAGAQEAVPSLAESPASEPLTLSASTETGLAIVESDAAVITSQVSEPRRRSRTYIWIAAAAAIVFLAAMVYLAFRHRAVKPMAQVRLGVVPFEASGLGAEQLAESFRLDLADALSQLPVVEIRATNSLGSTGRSPASIRSIAQTLDLDMLLLGQFAVQGDTCSVRFELVRGRDAVHLASFQYKGSREELSIIRDKLQRDIFLSLRSSETPIQQIHGSTENPQAYSEYLQAREMSGARKPDALEQALTHYNAAINHDPNFAQAYAGMATVNLNLRYFSDPEGHQRVAGQLAQIALRLDSSLAEAHAVLGDLAFRQSWNLARGESELRRAVELEPHKSEYHAWLAGLLADEGRFDEASREIDLAAAEDPLWPAVYSMTAFVAGAARDNDRMLAAVHKYEELAPESSWCHDQLAWAYFSAGRYPEALAEWRKMAVMDGDAKRIALEDTGLAAYRRGGIVAYGHTRIDAIKAHSVDLTRHANDFSLAEWYAFVGDRDQAMDALRGLIADRDGVVVALAVDPMFDHLHDDARFLGVLREVGLTLPHFASRTRSTH